MVTTAPLEPIRIHHIAKLEHIEIIWSIDHWSDDEKNSLLFYQATLSIESLSNQGRKRRNVETSCSEGDFFAKTQNSWLLRRRANWLSRSMWLLNFRNHVFVRLRSYSAVNVFFCPLWIFIYFHTDWSISGKYRIWYLITAWRNPVYIWFWDLSGNTFIIVDCYSVRMA